MDFTRRSFFATLFGGLLCKFLPKPAAWTQSGTGISKVLGPMRVDELDLSCWGKLLPISHYPKPSSLVFRQPHQVSVFFVTKNGYVTAPSPLHATKEGLRVIDIPSGPPDTATILFED